MNDNLQLWVQMPKDLKDWCAEQAANYKPPLSTSTWVRMKLQELKEGVVLSDWSCSGCSDLFPTELEALNHLLEAHPRVSIEDEDERQKKLKRRIKELKA